MYHVQRRRGFTLIELLVVIAIIGILAAMVFPVFARARESARKVVCLSNVKNVALAIQMYLADNNDILWPMIESRQEVNEYCDTVKGGGTDCAVAEMANPYMRAPVVLDEYVKNRDVWRCPSAKVEAGAGFIYVSPDWFSEFVALEGEPDPSSGGIYPCMETNPYPRGWGGVVTDSTTQGYAHMYTNQRGERAKAFAFSITVFHNGYSGRGKIALVEVEDPVDHIICGDSSGTGEYGNTIGAVAYPDLCGIECANTWGFSDWELASSGDCDDSLMFPDCWQVWAPTGDSHVANVSLRKPYARHLGGVNLGFLDGHATWMNSEALLAKFGEEAVQRGSAWGCAGCLFAYEGMGIFSALTPWTGGCDCPEWDTMPHLWNLQ